jgi:hypothetical protein
MNLKWETVAQEFNFDGTWRDIYVFDTTMADWQRMLDFLRASPYQVQYFRNSRQVEFPIQVAGAFPLPDECDRLLSVSFAGVLANCHFFTEAEIEFDIDPRDLKSQVELDALFGFMHRLAVSVGKAVVLTPGNLREIVVFRVRPGEAAIEWQEFGGWHGRLARSTH